MRNAISLALLFLLTTQIVVAEEQTACDGMRMVTKDAVLNSPSLDIASARIAASAADETEVEGLWHPRVSVFTSSSTGDAGLADSRIANQMGLQLSQRIYDFGQASLLRRQAVARSRRTEIDAELIKRQVAFEAGSTYLEFIANRDRQSALGETLDAQAQLETTLSGLLEKGLTTQSNLALVRARTARSRAQEQHLFRDQRRLLTRLETLLGRQIQPCESQVIQQELEAAVPTIPANEIVEALQERSLDLELIRADIDAAIAESESENRSRLPVINLSGTASLGSGSGPGEDWAYRDRLGIDLSVPLTSGNSISARQNRARANVREARARLNMATRDVNEAAVSLVQDIYALDAQLLTLDEAVSISRQELDFVGQEVERGINILPQILDSQDRFEDVSLELIARRLERQQQQLSLTINLDIW